MKVLIPAGLPRSLVVVTLSILLVSLLGEVRSATAQPAGPVRQPVASDLPADLFIMFPPPNAIDVTVARQNAEQGKPVVLQGRVGGAPAPIAENRAIFLMTDLRLPLCDPRCGCATPWDACCQPRELIMANVATVQVADQTGKPRKANLKGLHGLNPMAEVVVKGTIARKERNSLLVDAQYIYVKPSSQ